MNPLEYHNLFCEKRKEKFEKSMRFQSYFRMIENVLLSKFHFENLPNNIYSEYILKPLIRSGACIMADIPNVGWTVGVPTTEGVTAYSDVPLNAYLVTPVGESKMGKIGEEVAVGWNNYTHAPEFDIFRMATFFTEIDTSLKSAVMNSRLAPTILASNSTEKNQFEDLFKKIYEGKLNVAMLDRKMSSVASAMGADVSQDSQKKYVINLTDMSAVDKIQYLSKLFDDTLRRWCTWQGKPMMNTTKMAQVSIDELNDTQAFSKIYTLEQFECLKRFVDDVNRIYGLNVSVDFSNSWKEFQNGEKDFEEMIEDSNGMGGDNIDA